MKRILSIVLLFTIPRFAAIAQTETGSWMVGGNIGLNTAKNNTEITISPSAGYFFFRNFTAGVNLDFSYQKQFTTKTAVFGIGPFARYYVGTMNVRPFADVELSYESTKVKTTSTSSVNGTGFFIGGGLAAFINRNVAIEGLAGYKNKSIQDGPNTGGFNLRIGFQVYLSSDQVQNMKKGRLE